MYFLVFVFSILHLLFFCDSQSLDSAISCVFGSSKQFYKFNEEQMNLIFNKKNYSKSIESQIKFLFFSHEYPDGREFIFNDESSLKSCNFDPKRPTKIITHGFNGNADHDSCVGPTKAFLKNGNFNIFVMDWYKYQTGNFWFPLYWKVVKKYVQVGYHLAKLIDFLVEQGMNPNTTTLIGHSLGAHVVGVAGYNAKSKLQHVIGLDPAEPLLNKKGPGERISDQDANLVEIIHTNGNHCGMLKPLGHYDFYSNGGIKQPGCKRNKCSHVRSFELYVESIDSPIGFYGRRCHDKNIIGEDECDGELAMMGGLNRNSIENVIPGSYYFETNEKYPFAKGYTIFGNVV